MLFSICRKEREEGDIFIGEYLGREPKGRILFLLDHYREFPEFLNLYRENAIRLMTAMREYERKSKASIGMSVSNSGKKSSPTEAMAMEKIEVEDCFDQRKITGEVIRDPGELKLISTAVHEWVLMNKDYELLGGFMDMMKPEDRDLFISYISRKKRIADIAEEYCLAWESANKKMYRIRKALIDRMLPWMNDYKVSCSE